jgi:hypothetical protein
MQDDFSISRRAEILRALMEKHLGVRANTYARAVRLAGRQLPRAVRGQALRIVEAESMAEKPLLQRQVDSREIESAYQEVADWLRAIDYAEARRTRRLRWLAGTVLNLLVFFGLLLVVLTWRGLL